ncbi:DUF2161 family putative PD-(D/E)XK-type phosphodiesterase [Paenibacillus sp. CC-CFT747]|nr:DUF2161 family putative PD-(D/E)XK-type phosphodiesterase [Paenibacillus sp. CC-CFT747]
MAIKSETELYGPVKEFFERMGYEVKSEVRHCDLVALRGEEEPVLVELKRTFTLPLLIQGIDRLKQSTRVYVAVEQNAKGRAPHNLKWNDLQRLCRMLGLGLITVRFYIRRKPAVEVLCDPVPYTPALRKKSTERLLLEFKERSGDYNTGGSTRRKLMTAYREKALHCAHHLKVNGPSSTKLLREWTGNPKITLLLQDNYYLWFRRVSRGIYELTPLGEEALVQYEEVLRQVLQRRGGVSALPAPPALTEPVLAKSKKGRNKRLPSPIE